MVFLIQMELFTSTNSIFHLIRNDLHNLLENKK